jgi:M6 family metalloprotease-like protein
VDPAAYPHNSQRLVEEIVGKLGPATTGVCYDNNGDGLVDGVLIVAAGDGADETAPLDLPANRARLLAHQFHTTMEVAVSGARVFDYAIVAANARLGVVAHEVGHLFGLIDLYQAGGFAGPNGPFGLGDWSLMATGALLDGGHAPCHLDAWSKARLGFTHPTRLDTPGAGTFRLPAASDSAAVMRLWGCRVKTSLSGRGPLPARFRRRPAGGRPARLPRDRVGADEPSPARYRVALVQRTAATTWASLTATGATRAIPSRPRSESWTA